MVVQEIRAVIAERRRDIAAGLETSNETVEAAVEARLRALLSPSLRPVINATGVVLHTNLGRAPLNEFRPISRYSNLEYDLQAGKRGKRDAHTGLLLERLIQRPSIAVNNNAAAVFLVLHELAAGYEVIVSRGELIEIGDSFRIPEIMVHSGAVLREVGTTNRTRAADYTEAINERTRLIMRVHRSNFHMSGFTERPELTELAQLGREHGVPIYEDLGSGCLVDLKPVGIEEPLVSASVDAGVNVVSFSCDKLLGGPQSGIIAGDADLVNRIRRNPVYRALRLDKLVIEALETTLRHLLMENWTAIPTLDMIFESSANIQARAEKVAAELSGLDVTIAENESAIGGGSTPDAKLPSWVVQLAVPKPAAAEKRLRSGAPPVLARIEKERLLFDMRTVADEEVERLVAAIRNACA